MNRSLSKESSQAAIRISGLVGPAVLALFCVCVVPAGSQTKPAAANSTFASGSVPAAVQALPGAAAEKPSANPLAPKGHSEGIKVHGQWTIEVRNPDGKLVIHREFENEFTLGPGQGSTLLTDLLGRTLIAGAWDVGLVTNGGSGSMHMDEPNTTQASICSSAACSPTLSVVAGTSQNPGVLTLTGYVAVPAGQTSITGVQTDNLACIPTLTPSACLTVSYLNVNQGSSGQANVYPFTQTTLATPITIAPGQVVQAAVNISYQ